MEEESKAVFLAEGTKSEKSLRHEKARDARG